MAENKKSFVLYADLLKCIEHLTNEEKGILFNHLLEYVNDKNPILTDRLILTAWKPIETQLKRDLNKYKDIQETKSINGRMGNLKRYNIDIYKKVESGELTLIEGEKLAKTRKASQTVANVAVNVNDNVNVNVSDNVSVNDNVNVIQRGINKEEAPKKNNFEFSETFQKLKDETEKKDLLGGGGEFEIIDENQHKRGENIPLEFSKLFKTFLHSKKGYVWNDDIDTPEAIKVYRFMKKQAETEAGTGLKFRQDEAFEYVETIYNSLDAFDTNNFSPAYLFRHFGKLASKKNGKMSVTDLEAIKEELRRSDKAAY